MIRRLSVNKEVASPGDEVTLSIEGRGPFSVSFACFVEDPPPAGFKECDACQTRSFRESEFSFIVEEWWISKNGRISIRAKDSDGDSKSVNLSIVGSEGARAMTSSSA